MCWWWDCLWSICMLSATAWNQSLSPLQPTPTQPAHWRSSKGWYMSMSLKCMELKSWAFSRKNLSFLWEVELCCFDAKYRSTLLKVQESLWGRAAAAAAIALVYREKIMLPEDLVFNNSSWNPMAWSSLSFKKRTNFAQFFLCLYLGKCVGMVGRVGCCVFFLKFAASLYLWMSLKLFAGLWFLGLSRRSFTSFCNTVLATGLWMPLSELYVPASPP